MRLLILFLLCVCFCERSNLDASTTIYSIDYFLSRLRSDPIRRISFSRCLEEKDVVLLGVNYPLDYPIPLESMLQSVKCWNIVFAETKICSTAEHLYLPLQSCLQVRSHQMPISQPYPPIKMNAPPIYLSERGGLVLPHTRFLDRRLPREPQGWD